MLIENKRRGTLRLRHGVTLPPGCTDVDDAAWEKCRDDSITRHYLAAGEVVVVAPSPPKPVDVASARHPRMPARDAIAAVRCMTDAEMLGLMQQAETRSTVVAAIAERLEELQAAENPQPEAPVVVDELDEDD